MVEQKKEQLPAAPIEIVKRALATIASLLARQPVLVYVEWIAHAGFVPGKMPTEVGTPIRASASVLLARGDVAKIHLSVPDSSRAHWHCYARVVDPADGFLFDETGRPSREIRERDVDSGGVVVAVSRGDFGWGPVPVEAKPHD